MLSRRLLISVSFNVLASVSFAVTLDKNETFLNESTTKNLIIIIFFNQAILIPQLSTVAISTFIMISIENQPNQSLFRVVS